MPIFGDTVGYYFYAWRRRVSCRGGVSRREEYLGGEACLNERSIPVERRVSTRGVFRWWIGVSLDRACAQ